MEFRARRALLADKVGSWDGGGYRKRTSSCFTVYNEAPSIPLQSSLSAIGIGETGFWTIWRSHIDDIAIPYIEINIKRISHRIPSKGHLVMDATAVEFDAESFDVVLEKATIDSLLVEEKDPWNMSSTSSQLLHKIMTQVSRILKNNGKFISITFAQPHFRKLIYCNTEYNWSYECKTFGSSFHFFFYVMTKGGKLDPKDIPVVKEQSCVPMPCLSEDEEDYIMKISEDI
ncbi:unnamed protein product [Meganyctiphanes norvegica]|uniref:Methyltransferase type 11 domain-containing protein n=1 Tax=Meganyctiphanes norvegica TaxID=48144 RepID=A0AAV2PQK3_MEGNR